MQTTNGTLMPAVRQVFFDYRSALATFLACASWFNCYNFSSSFFRFEEKLLSKLRPGNISNTFIKFVTKSFSMIIHHTFDFKFFNTNNPKLINNSTSLLMSEIMPSIRNSFVNTNNDLFKSLPSGRALSLFRQFSLCFGKSLLLSLKKTGVSYLLFGGKSSKSFQPNINTNRFIRFKQRVILIFTRETDIPFVSLSSNSASFNNPFRGTMKFNFNRTYLRKFDSIVNYSKTRWGKVKESYLSSPLNLG